MVKPVGWQMEAGNCNRYSYSNELLGYIQKYEIAFDSMDIMCSTFLA